MNVIVAGGRDFKDSALMTKCLNLLIGEGLIPQEATLVTGMAQGADITAWGIWKANSWPIQEYPANWSDVSVPGAVIKHNSFGLYNAVAGHQRNALMEQNADMLVAFWNGKSKGTADMISRIRKAKKPWFIFDYQGNLQMGA